MRYLSSLFPCFLPPTRSVRWPLLLALLLGLSQCDSLMYYPADKLPDATQTGANTGGCLVDGQPWAARVDYGVGVLSTPPVTVMSGYTLLKDEYWLSISLAKAVDAADQPNNETWIKIYLPKVSRTGTYVLDHSLPAALMGSYGASDTPAYGMVTIRRPLPEQYLFTSPTSTGWLTLSRFDTQSGIISGTFEFTANNPATGRTVHLTQGRFDITSPL